MTETTTDRPVDTSATGTAVTRWLADFEKTLTARDIDAVSGLFVDDIFKLDEIPSKFYDVFASIGNERVVMFDQQSRHL